MERKVRSWIKSLTWRVLGIIILVSISFAYTCDIKQTTAITLIFHLIRFILYYIHERIWLKFSWGKIPGLVIWFTGLPCSGKTTLAKALKKILEKSGFKVEHLDGDIIRKTKLSSDLGFSKGDREKHLRRIGVLTHFLSKNGTIVLCSFVSPYRKIRKELRGSIHNFIEVYVKCPKKECIRRDVKGMWKKALQGEIKDFTGVGSPYEPPLKPHIIVDTNKDNIDTCIKKILKYLKRRKLL